MDSKTARIRALNDELRQNFAGGVAVMTPGIAALDLSHIPSWCPDRFRRVLSLSPKPKASCCRTISDTASDRASSSLVTAGS
jgi:hypothetical protein